MNKFAKQLLPFCSLIFIISLWACLEPENFLSFQNFSNVLRRSSVNGIMAAGMTFIIITAGIDLSVGSMLAMCGTRPLGGKAQNRASETRPLGGGE